MPTAPYNTSPYHLPMARFHAPEDLSRNPNTKALDILQHHASQYYNNHKIHELSERALKSPTSGAGGVKVSVSSPNVQQQQSQQQQQQQQGLGGGGPGGGPLGPNSLNPGGDPGRHNPGGGLAPPPNSGGGSLNLQPPPPTSMPLGSGGVPLGGASQKGSDKMLGGSGAGPGAGGPGSGAGDMPPSAGIGIGGGNIGPPLKDSSGRSPPPQRHVHTHHHTHVGLGYPMYPAPYGGELSRLK